MSSMPRARRCCSANVSTDTISQQVQYGVTDDGIALRFDWGYVISRSASRHLDAGLRGGPWSSGWTDPDFFGITWRAIDQRAGGPLSLDLRADYSPDAFPAKSPSPDDEGTVARGGQALDLGLTIGHQTRDFTLAGLFDAEYLGSQKALNQNNGSILRSDSVWNYTLGLASQTRLNDAFLHQCRRGTQHLQQRCDRDQRKQRHSSRPAARRLHQRERGTELSLCAEHGGGFDRLSAQFLRRRPAPSSRPYRRATTRCAITTRILSG